MDKKDIYEHLAKIYLDASLKRKKKTKRYLNYKSLFLIGIVIFGIFTIFLLTHPNKHKPLSSEFLLVLQPEIVKINFHFDPAKKEIYSINLNKLDLSRFKTLKFSVRKVNFEDRIFLKIEFTNRFNEKAEIYLQDLSHRWQNYKIALSDFKNITDWSEMSNLSFVIEEWLVKAKKGIVYLDNIRFSR